MTTNMTPADPGRHLLTADDSAELLAEARLSLRETPADCLLLAGLGSPAAPPMITSSPLRELLRPQGGEDLERHLRLLRDRSGGDVHALIVVGDGYQEVLPGVVEEILGRAGAEVHRAAASAAAGARLLAVHGAATATCWEVPPAPRGRALAGAPTGIGRLRPFEETSAAAAAVLQGLPIPQPEGCGARLAEIGRRLELPPPDPASAEDPAALFGSARVALEDLLDEDVELSGQEAMTKCERIAALLSAVAVDRLHWELLARCVEHGSALRIDRESLLQTLVAERSWIPHPDVCAGGKWYRALERLRRIAAAARDRDTGTARPVARSAWRALTTLLVLLAWWNHRFATAGGFVDELRAQEPGSTLAPLLSRMTDTPIFPAWWPST